MCSQEDSQKREENLKLYSPPFVLASTKSRQNQIMEAKTEQQTILFCGYCLSEDQRWLLAVCTDERGELMECCTINIEIPNRCVSSIDSFVWLTFVFMICLLLV